MATDNDEPGQVRVWPEHSRSTHLHLLSVHLIDLREPRFAVKPQSSPELMRRIHSLAFAGSGSGGGSIEATGQGAVLASTLAWRRCGNRRCSQGSGIASWRIVSQRCQRSADEGRAGRPACLRCCRQAISNARLLQVQRMMHLQPSMNFCRYHPAIRHPHVQCWALRHVSSHSGAVCATLQVKPGIKRLKPPTSVIRASVATMCDSPNGFWTCRCIDEQAAIATLQWARIAPHTSYASKHGMGFMGATCSSDKNGIAPGGHNPSD